MEKKTRIHFIEMDLDHYGQFEDIHEHDTFSKIEDFELVIMDDYGKHLYQTIKISDSERMFILAGNMRIYAWESNLDLENTKFYRHAKRYDKAMTKKEFREKE